MQAKKSVLFLCLILTGCGQGLDMAGSPLSIKSLTANSSNQPVTEVQDNTPAARPVFRWVSDATGLPATKILVYGQYFTGTTEVVLNGQSVPFSIGSDKQLLLTVAPETVATSLSVTNAAGTTSLSVSETPEGHE